MAWRRRSTGSLSDAMAAGISISEDPNFRFTFKPDGAKKFRAEDADRAGKTFFGRIARDRNGVLAENDRTLAFGTSVVRVSL
jgi:hypothetical protein